MAWLVVNSKQWLSLWAQCTYSEVKSVIGVRHKHILIGTLQLETMRDSPVRCAGFAVAVEVVQTVTVAQFLEVFVCAVHPTCAQVLHNTYDQISNSLNMSDQYTCIYCNWDNTAKKMNSKINLIYFDKCNWPYFVSSVLEKKKKKFSFFQKSYFLLIRAPWKRFYFSI